MMLQILNIQKVTVKVRRIKIKSTCHSVYDPPCHTHETLMGAGIHTWIKTFVRVNLSFLSLHINGEKWKVFMGSQEEGQMDNREQMREKAENIEDEEDKDETDQMASENNLKQQLQLSLSNSDSNRLFL